MNPHDTGDCWAPTCPACEREDERATPPLFIAGDAHDNPCVWRTDPERPDYPQPVLRRHNVKDDELWDLIVEMVGDL